MSKMNENVAIETSNEELDNLALVDVNGELTAESEVIEETYDNSKIQKTDLLITQKNYVKEGKQYHAYYVKTNLGSHAIEISFVPNGKLDRNGYVFLDIEFEENGGKMPLCTLPYSFADEKGKVSKGINYGIEIKTLKGNSEFIKLKPFRDSDKAFLTKLLG